MSFTRYANPDETGVEFEIWSGRNFQIRFYCHDTVGVSVALFAEKPPVCHLSLTPRIQTLGVAIAWNIANSFSATDTVDTYTIDWGGATDIGNLTGADFQATTSGNVVYNSLGTYTVNAFVTDVLTTESQHCIQTVQIVKPPDRLYIGTSDLGVFLSDNGDTPAASNAGLSGDDLKLRSIRLNPAYLDLAATAQHVWLVMKTGLAKSTDGAATYTKMLEAALGTPENAAGDSPAPATADLDQIDACFDPQDPDRVYVLRTQASPKRAWLYLSGDYGSSWDNEQVET